MEQQKLLFERIRSKLDANLRLADVIGDILQIGSDSTYRRLRGEKELSFTELVKLCDYFKISLDSLMNHQKDSVLFKYSPLEFHKPDVYDLYIRQVSDLYISLVNSRAKSFLISAQDIPIFHFQPFVDLTFFKLYAMNQSESKDFILYEDFVATLDREKLAGYYDNIYNAFLQIPSTEVWSLHTVEPLLNLLEYNIDLNVFKEKKTITLLCSQFLQMIEKVEKMAIENCKMFKGIKTEYNLYLSPIDMQNDFIITTRDSLSVTSVKLFTINAIFTSDNMFTKETENWIRHIISKSVLISGTSERERFRFFQDIKKRIHHLAERVNEL